MLSSFNALNNPLSRLCLLPDDDGKRPLVNCGKPEIDRHPCTHALEVLLGNGQTRKEQVTLHYLVQMDCTICGHAVTAFGVMYTDYDEAQSGPLKHTKYGFTNMRAQTDLSELQAKCEAEGETDLEGSTFSDYFNRFEINSDAIPEENREVTGLLPDRTTCPMMKEEDDQVEAFMKEKTQGPSQEVISSELPESETPFSFSWTTPKAPEKKFRISGLPNLTAVWGYRGISNDVLKAEVEKNVNYFFGYYEPKDYQFKLGPTDMKRRIYHLAFKERAPSRKDLSDAINANIVLGPLLPGLQPALLKLEVRPRSPDSQDHYPDSSGDQNAAALVHLRVHQRSKTNHL